MADSRGELTTFDYDERGHKTETRVVKDADERKTPKAIGIDVTFADIDGTTLMDYSFGATP